MRLTLLIPASLLVAASARTADLDSGGHNRADEPRAERYSAVKAAEFLDDTATDWLTAHRCGSCHTTYAYLLGRTSLAAGDPAPQADIRAFFEMRVAGWDGPEISDKPLWDAEVVATAATLAINDADTSGTLHPRTKGALDRMWTLQKPDGSWNWLKCGWPPLEYDDYYGAVYAAVGVGHAPKEYRDSPAAAAGIERLRSYLTKAPAPNRHHRAFLLWASCRIDGLMDSRARERTAKDLLALQRPDGGWSLPSLGSWQRRDGSANPTDAASDGYAIGLVLVVLRESGLPADDAIKRGVEWLRTNQRASGRWFTRSLNNDKDHYITHAGTAFAARALRACEPNKTAAAR